MKTEIKITPDRATCLYLKGETAVFTIEVRKNGKPVKEGKLRVSTAQDGGPGHTTIQTFDLAVSGNPLKLPAKLEKPCFCLCQAWYEGVYAERNVYCRIQAHVDEILRLNLVPNGGTLKASVVAQPADPPRPADFDAFWEETLRKARQLPEDMKLEKLPEYSRPDATYYKFSMNSFNGDRVHGFLGIPTGKGPFPIIALFPGKGPAAIEPIDCGWPAAGCITIMFNVHKYPIQATAEESKQKMLEYARSHGVEDYWNIGIKHRETFHFYSILPGFCRVLDYVCREYPWDGRRLVLEGSSQGGWMVLCLGALYRERVTAIYAGVPAVGLSSRLPGKRLMKRDIPPYFEADYFAPRITAPIMVSAGLLDPGCRANTISAMFTLLASRNKTLETDAGVHMGSPLRYERKRAFVLRALGISSRRTVHIPETNNELIAVRGDMLHKYYLKKYQALDRKRDARLAKIQSREDAEKYMAEVREKLKRIFGPMPPTDPIRPQITGQTATEKLVIDKVLFQSRPGYYVSALFYRPKTFRGKLPGVLFLCGHTSAGKQGSTYQRVPQSLALRGFGVLAVDPYGQGERREHDGGAAAEHNHFGQRLALLGEFFGTWRLHDALVSLEYLKSRPEIDRSKLGVTGCSGGGTMTSYVTAFSPDLMMAAPVCSMTRMTSNLENELFGDCEQNPPGFRAAGLDEDDLLLAYAPRPTLLGVQDNDFFDPRGTMKMYESMRKFCGLFGKSDAVKYSLGKGDHAYSVFHQREVGEFFASLAGAEAVGTDDDIRLFKEEELFCTPEGSVWKLPDARSSEQILAELLALKGNDPGKNYGRLPAELTAGRIPVPAYRKGIHQHLASPEIQISRFIIETEPGIEVTLKKFGKEIEKRLPELETAVIFLPEDDGIRETDLRDYNENPQNYFVLEVRGCGESRPCQPECDLNSIFQGLYPACGRLLGEEFLHGQVRDVVSTLQLLKKHGIREVTLIAEGTMCAVAAGAAELSPVRVQLRLKHPSVGRKTFLLNPKAVLAPKLCLFGR